MRPSQESRHPATPFVRSTRITLLQLIFGTLSVLLGTALTIYYFLNRDIETSVPPITSLTGLQAIEETMATAFGLGKSGKSDKELLEAIEEKLNSTGTGSLASMTKGSSLIPALNATGKGVHLSSLGELLKGLKELVSDKNYTTRLAAAINKTDMNKTMIDFLNKALSLKNSTKNVTHQAQAFDAAYITSPMYCGFIYLLCALISITCLRKVLAVKHNQKGLVCAVLSFGTFALISCSMQTTFSGWYGWYVVTDYLDNKDDPRKKFLASGLIVSSLLGGIQLYLSMFLIGVSCCCPGQDDVMAATDNGAAHYDSVSVVCFTALCSEEYHFIFKENGVWVTMKKQKLMTEIHEVMAYAVRPIHDRFRRRRRPSRRSSRRHSRSGSKSSAVRPPSSPAEDARRSRHSVLRVEDQRRHSRAEDLRRSSRSSRADDVRRSSRGFQEPALHDQNIAEGVPRRLSRSPNALKLMAEPPPKRQSRSSRGIEYLPERPRSYSRPRTESRSSGNRV